MKANIAKLRSELSSIIDRIQNGETCEIQKRNIVVAKIIPIKKKSPNKTKLGCGLGSCQVMTDLTDPVMETDWEMNKQTDEG